ncbi:Acyl-CoA synthetase (AMP-forming)/AMP-acid ligase II [Candidatus Sulfotelmatobacter kueseliae]|uniref:Acyl-CoA synthetase (AMP-forming)/AMP-acid ligase II n=1 Tax=Candidatus Sulfotelmatobacter kueseliae TaxID=2042962 RepID=A0A2U3KKM3_9BACT|nr:Acyl-CoA synthetase (AMP-forming)/AMP-acid ligase II [Candidatus Sulfotelmatobacter kueseliae]
MRNGIEGNFARCLVERLGETSCLIDAATGQTVPSHDLPNLIVGFAAGLRSAGLGPGDRMLVGCRVSPASTLAYLGAMYAGVVPVPTEERLLSASGGFLLAQSQAKVVWTDKGTKCDWLKSHSVCHIEGTFEACSPDSLPPHPCAENDLAVLMPTSGSTGVPRLVMVAHSNLKSNTEAIIRSQRLGTDERAMLIMPVSYCFGASVMHTHLYQGGGVVFDSRFMFPDKVLHAINTYGCTTFAGVPVIYNVLLRRSNLKSIPLPSLRRFLQAGGALAPENVREMRHIVPTAEFLVMYGQTEATARISCLPKARLQEKLGSAGIPLDNLEVRIVDEEGREVPQGQIGEIQVRGPSVCFGYLDDPESTDRKFGGGWLKTGDFACCDKDGYLWIKGRTDEFIKIRGVRVSVGEVETKVAAMPGVSECAAVAVKHPEAGEALALLIVPDNSATESAVAENHGDDLGDRIRRALPPHWTCASVKIVAELPRTTNGKIARSQLQTLL